MEFGIVIDTVTAKVEEGTFEGMLLKLHNSYAKVKSPDLASALSLERAASERAGLSMKKARSDFLVNLAAAAGSLGTIGGRGWEQHRGQLLLQVLSDIVGQCVEHLQSLGDAQIVGNI